MENVSILVAVGVGMDGRREVLSVAEGVFRQVGVSCLVMYFFRV